MIFADMCARGCVCVVVYLCGKMNIIKIKQQAKGKRDSPAKPEEKQADEREKESVERRAQCDVIVSHIVNVGQEQHHHQQNLFEDINSFIQKLLLKFQQHAHIPSIYHTYAV